MLLEPESDCCWCLGGRPYDRLDTSAASGTRSAGSCGAQKHRRTVFTVTTDDNTTIKVHSRHTDSVSVQNLCQRLTMLEQDLLLLPEQFVLLVTWSGKCDYKVVSWLR